MLDPLPYDPLKIYSPDTKIILFEPVVILMIKVGTLAAFLWPRLHQIYFFAIQKFILVVGSIAV